MTSPFSPAPSSWTLDAPVRRRRTWTPQLLTQLVVVLAVLVAGVAGAGVLRSRHDSGDVLKIVQAASSTAAKQSTFRATYLFRIEGNGVNIETTGNLLEDTARQIASGTVTAPILGQISMVSAAGVTYTQLPGGRADASGHHWLSFTVLKPGTQAPIASQDPLAALKLVSDPKKVLDVGRERIHGISTEHYRVQLDPARLADSLAKSNLNLSIPPSALDSLKGSAVDLWLDGKNLPRRMEMTFNVSGVKAFMHFDYLDYGKPFDVTAPPATDVTTYSSPQEFGAALAQAVQQH